MLSLNVTKDIADIVTKKVQDYLDKDGKTQIEKQVDIILKERDEVNKAKQNQKQLLVSKINTTANYGTTDLTNIQSLHTNEQLLATMKNKINYGVTPDAVSSNNGAMNYKGY